MNIRKSVKTSFMPEAVSPSISQSAKVNKEAIIIGAVIIADGSTVDAMSVIRGDEGFYLYIGKGVAIRSEVIIHGLETFEHGEKVEKNLVKIGGKEFSVFVEDYCTLDAGVQVHGPCLLESNVVMRPDSFAFKATIGKGSIIGQGSKVIGVNIPAGSYVPPGITITTQKQADELQKVGSAEEPKTIQRKDYLKDKNVNSPLKIKKGVDTFVDSKAVLAGEVELGDEVYVAPYAYIIADKEEIIVEDRTNIQDGAVISYGTSIRGVIIGEEVSFAHQSKIFGGKVGDHTFIGMQSELYNVVVESHCVVEPGCIVDGILVPTGRYVPAGSKITNQKQADELPRITDDYVFKHLNDDVVHVNEQLAKGYSMG